MRARLNGHFIVLLASTLWVGFILSPVILSLLSTPATAWSMLVRLFFSPVCHQDPARSFTLAGILLPVCHRCSGIYAGFAVTALLYRLMPAVSRAPWGARMLVLLAPLLADYFLDVIGVWTNTTVSRSVSGGIAGAALALIIIPAWESAFIQWRTMKRSNPIILHEVSHG